jgi:hypothetical protein
MRAKREEAARLILTEAALQLHPGRPRKLPGKDRPETDGIRFSTPAAINLVTRRLYKLGMVPKATAYRARQLAVQRLCSESDFWRDEGYHESGFVLEDVATLDFWEQDTRTIIRDINRAAKTLKS